MTAIVKQFARPPLPKRAVIVVSPPYPLLDSGRYLAPCMEATSAWARQWKKWIGRLTLEPANYSGRPYTGKLCKFLSLGSDPSRPFAGQHSLFRHLWVDVNGAQPGSSEVTMQIFEGVLFCVAVETVTRDRNGKERAPEHWYSIARDIHRARPDCPAHSNTAPVNTST